MPQTIFQKVNFYAVHNVWLPEKYKIKGENGPIIDLSPTHLYKNFKSVIITSKISQFSFYRIHLEIKIWKTDFSAMEL